MTIYPSSSIIESQNYLVIDTGIVADDSFISKMLKYNNAPVKKSLISGSCIGTIVPLLSEIGPAYIPSGLLEYIPSNYLRKVLKNGRFIKKSN